jgi:hypothetical protein
MNTDTDKILNNERKRIREREERRREKEREKDRRDQTFI